MKIKGRLAFGNVHSSRSGPDGTSRNYVKLELVDVAASIKFVSIDLTYAEFGRALITNGEVDVEIDCHLERVGMVRQWKTELVPFDCFSQRAKHKYGNNPEAWDRALKDALAPFEVDGWIGSAEDLENPHNRRDVKGQRVQEVRFERWVSPSSAAAE